MCAGYLHLLLQTPRPFFSRLLCTSRGINRVLWPLASYWIVCVVQRELEGREPLRFQVFIPLKSLPAGLSAAVYICITGYNSRPLGMPHQPLSVSPGSGNNPTPCSLGPWDGSGKDALIFVWPLVTAPTLWLLYTLTYFVNLYMLDSLPCAQFEFAFYFLWGCRLHIMSRCIFTLLFTF